MRVQTRLREAEMIDTSVSVEREGCFGNLLPFGYVRSRFQHPP